MKSMFNYIVRSVVVIATFGLLATSCGDSSREEVLKIYNWGDYIDEDLLTEFEEWYEQKTGEKVSIIYQTFDINEVMLAKIEKGEADFDVVCPSEYIIERMMRNDLLLPIVDDDFKKDLANTDTENCIERYVSPYIQDQFADIIAPKGHNPKDYSVGYMWGTTGILYNCDNVTDEEASSWDLLFDERLEGKILIKDAFRDVYSPMLVYAKTLEARESGAFEGQEINTLPLNDSVRLARGLGEDVPTITSLMFDSSDESIALVEGYLKQMKRLVAGWEADFGKEMMTQNKAWINLMWSGDAVWAIEEAAEVDVNLDYVVPEEGSCVWFDGWVIPKYAKNTRAARYFINYMCMPENAVRNMDATGYVSVIADPHVLMSMDEYLYEMNELLVEMAEDDIAEEKFRKLEKQLAELMAERDAALEEDGINLSYFFKDDNGDSLVFTLADIYDVESEYLDYEVRAECVCVDPIMYPDIDVIGRCAMMHDSYDQTDKMLEMWSRVKGDNLSPMMLLFIIVSFVVIIVWGVWHKIAKRRKTKMMLKRRHHERKTK